MAAWGKLAGNVYDEVFAVRAGQQNSEAEKIEISDARIKHWQATVLPTFPFWGLHDDSVQAKQRMVIHTVSYEVGPFASGVLNNSSVLTTFANFSAALHSFLGIRIRTL